MFSHHVNEYINEMLSLQHFVDTASSHILQDAEFYRMQNDKSLLIQAYFIAELRLKCEETSESDKENYINIMKSAKDSLSKYYAITENKLNEIYNTIDSPDYLVSLGKVKYWNRIKDMESDLHKITFINTVIVTEKFFSSIIKEFISKSPKLFGKESIKFSIADLSEYETIDQLKDYAASIKTEEVLRGNFENWLKFLSSYTISIDKISNMNNQISEIFQRRNLLVHNDGVVNSIYISKVSDAPYNIGDKLKIDIDYFHSSLTMLEEYFISISFEIWNKLQRNDTSKEKDMISIISKLILNKHYISAINICNFCKNKMFLDENLKLIVSIHQYTALKNMNQLQSSDIEVLREISNGKHNTIYELAQYILLDKENEAINLFIKLYIESKISLYDYFTWPILQKLRFYPNFRSEINNCNNEKLKKAGIYIYSGLEEYDNDIISLLFARNL